MDYPSRVYFTRSFANFHKHAAYACVTAPRQKRRRFAICIRFQSSKFNRSSADADKPARRV